MKCNKCGQEFGHGTNCIHCGVDRVEGLGNYHGYTTTSGNSTVTRNDQSVKDVNVTYSQKKREPFAACYSCGEIIPASAKFCPKCGKELYHKCPKCGSEFSSQYPICPNCGTNREQYLKEREEAKIRAEKYRQSPEFLRKMQEIKERDRKKQKDEEKLREQLKIQVEERERKRKAEETLQYQAKCKRESIYENLYSEMKDTLISTILKCFAVSVLFGFGLLLAYGFSNHNHLFFYLGIIPIASLSYGFISLFKFFDIDANATIQADKEIQRFKKENPKCSYNKYL